MKLDVSAETLIGLGLDGQNAAAMARRLEALAAADGEPETWRTVSRTLLTPDIPFAVHLHLYKSIFAGWDWSQGPPPAWTPSEDEIRQDVC